MKKLIIPIVAMVAIIMCSAISAYLIGRESVMNGTRPTKIEERQRCEDANFGWSEDGNGKVVCLHTVVRTASNVQACIDAGGAPIISAWDGMLKRCDFPSK